MATFSNVAVLLRTIRIAIPSGNRSLRPCVSTPLITRCLATWSQSNGNRKTMFQPWWAAHGLPASCEHSSGLGGSMAHIATPSPLLLHINTMKKKSAIKRRCKDCKIVIKDKKAYVICKTSPRHNQEQG